MKHWIVTSFFFNARGGAQERSLAGMYRSLLLQLFQKLPELEDGLNSPEFASWNNRSHQWDLDSLEDLFKQAVRRLENHPLVCSIDALDECDGDQIRDMILFWVHIGGMAESTGISFQICLPSRHYPFIQTGRGPRWQQGHSEISQGKLGPAVYRLKRRSRPPETECNGHSV